VGGGRATSDASRRGLLEQSLVPQEGTASVWKSGFAHSISQPIGIAFLLSLSDQS
jgi:hypothetical protein